MIKPQPYELFIIAVHHFPQIYRAPGAIPD